MRFVPCTGVAPMETKNLPIDESATLGVAEQIGDPSQNDRRADIAEEMDEEDKQRITGRAAVGGDDERRHRVAGSQHHRHQDTDAKKRKASDDRYAGSRMPSRPKGIAASTASAASSR